MIMDYFSAPDIKSHIEAKWSFCSIEIICSDVDLFQNFVKESIPNIFYINSKMRQLYNYYKYGLGLIFFTVLLWIWKTSVVVQWLSRVQLFATLCTAAHQASLPFTISWSSLKFMFIELVMLIILPSIALFSFCLQSFPASKASSMRCFFEWGGQSILKCSASELSHLGLSCVWLFVTPWTAALQAPVHGILQARILEWVAIPFSRGSSQPRNWTTVSCIVGKFFTTWATTLNTLF